MVATTFALTQTILEQKFDLVINIGIAGAFESSLEIGSVVQVVSDRLSELGVEDNGAFIPADELNLCVKGEVYFETDVRVAGLLEVAGITVNQVHGSAETIESIKRQFIPDVESMEGAAVAYVCQKFNIPWVQLRAISNKVEPRNRESWNISLAIENLHTAVLAYLKTFENEA